MPKSASKPSCVGKLLRESCSAVSAQRGGEEGGWSRNQHPVSVFSISEACYRYQVKLDGENAL